MANQDATSKPETKPDCPPASCWASNLEDAMESLRKCRRHITDEEGKQLLYHAGMTIRDLQQRYDPSERNLARCLMCGEAFIPTDQNRTACKKCLNTCKGKDGRP